VTDLNVKRIAHWGPTCETGRHYPPHPGDTCDEIDEWIALRDAWLEQHIGAAFDRAFDGDHDGAMTGLIAMADAPEPTPMERALAILAPHLRREPLYRPTR
jgi:hypothetical protein